MVEIVRIALLLTSGAVLCGIAITALIDRWLYAQWGAAENLAIELLHERIEALEIMGRNGAQVDEELADRREALAPLLARRDTRLARKMRIERLRALANLRSHWRIWRRPTPQFDD